MLPLDTEVTSGPILQSRSEGVHTRALQRTRTAVTFLLDKLNMPAPFLERDEDTGEDGDMRPTESIKKTLISCDGRAGGDCGVASNRTSTPGSPAAPGGEASPSERLDTVKQRHKSSSKCYDCG